MLNENDLERKLRSRSARVAIVGLGYAGLPMAVEFARAGFPCVGLDVDAAKVEAITRGRSPVSNVADEEIEYLENKEFNGKGRDVLKQVVSHAQVPKNIISWRAVLGKVGRIKRLKIFDVQAGHAAGELPEKLSERVRRVKSHRGG